MTNRTPNPNEIYQHFKGNLYKVLTLAKHSETGETLVIYQALYGKFGVYARPLDSFLSEVDHRKYPDAEAKYRFTLVSQVLTLEFAESDKEFLIPKETGKEAVKEAGKETGKEPVNEPVKKPEPAETIDPALMDFLDADTYKEKLEILSRLHSRITDRMINTMAVSLDLEVAEGPVEERYYELKNCLITLEKYECDRLR